MSTFRLLLVEDNEGDVEMTERALSDGDLGCSLHVVNDGMEAMDYLRKCGAHAGAVPPSLILLDLNMPRMDGKQFLEAVKDDPKLKAIPVIMFTSSKSPGDIRACYERHASCYIVKPFDGKQFADTLREIVRFWKRLVVLPQG